MAPLEDTVRGGIDRFIGILIRLPQWSMRDGMGEDEVAWLNAKVAWEAKALLRKGQCNVIEYNVFDPKAAKETVNTIKPESEETEEGSDYDEDEGHHKYCPHHERAGQSPNTMFKRLCKTFSAAIIEAITLYEKDYSRNTLWAAAPKSEYISAIFLFFSDLYEIKTVLKSDRVTVFEDYPLDEAVVCVACKMSLFLERTYLIAVIIHLAKVYPTSNLARFAPSMAAQTRKIFSEYTDEYFDRLVKPLTESEKQLRNDTSKLASKDDPAVKSDNQQKPSTQPSPQSQRQRPMEMPQPSTSAPQQSATRDTREPGSSLDRTLEDSQEKKDKSDGTVPQSKITGESSGAGMPGRKGSNMKMAGKPSARKHGIKGRASTVEVVNPATTVPPPLVNQDSPHMVNIGIGPKPSAGVMSKQQGIRVQLPDSRT